jgi:hypothetical protein
MSETTTCACMSCVAQRAYAYSAGPCCPKKLSHATACCCGVTVTAPLDAGRATETMTADDLIHSAQLSENEARGFRSAWAREAAMERALRLRNGISELTALRARLDASERVREAAEDALCECGHVKSGHVVPGWWTGSPIAWVVCYDGQGGNPSVLPRLKFRASLAPTTEGTT